MKLNQPEFLRNGYRRIAFGEVESTNLIAMEHARKAEPGKLWITANRQLRGKGSRGRSWVSEPGNLYASLLIKTDTPPEKLANLTFVASLAAYESLARTIPKSQLALKWPNDLLLDQAKVCGILLESHIGQNQNSAVIIGFGVNCRSNPDHTNFPSTNMLKAGFLSEPETVFQHLLVEMDQWLEVWDNGANFSTIRREWLDRAVGIGDEILVKSPHFEMHGIFAELDRNGSLILITPDNCRHTISAADIFLAKPNNKVH